MDNVYTSITQLSENDVQMFVSAHYSGEELVPKFEEGEPWNHIYGPIFMYMNNATKQENISMLWDDAKRKVAPN